MDIEYPDIQPKIEDHNYLLEHKEMMFISEDIGCHHEIIFPKDYKF
jgi:hypothetical protein